jgi:hypothetical protein
MFWINLGVVQTLRMREIRDLVNREGGYHGKLCSLCRRMIVWE